MLFQSIAQILWEGEQLENKTANGWAAYIHSKWEKSSLKIIYKTAQKEGKKKKTGTSEFVSYTSLNVTKLYIQLNTSSSP